MSDGGREREQKLARRGSLVLFACGAAVAVAAWFSRSPLGVTYWILSAFLGVVAWRWSRTASVALEVARANAELRADDREALERSLRAQARRATDPTQRERIVHELVTSLWMRAAFDEVDAALTEFVARGAYVVAEPIGAYYANLQSLRALLAAARGGDLDAAVPAIERACTIDEVGRARVAAARAIIALRAGDRTAAVAGLRGLDAVHRALPMERALYRALFALANAGAPSDAYRSPKPPTRGDSARSWVERLFAAAADFVDEFPRKLYAGGEWEREPSVDAKDLPVLPRLAVSRRSRIVAASLIVCALLFYLASEGHLSTRVSPYVLATTAAALAIAVFRSNRRSKREYADIAALNRASRDTAVSGDAQARDVLASLAATASREMKVSALVTSAILALDFSRFEEATQLLDEAIGLVSHLSSAAVNIETPVWFSISFVRAHLAAARADELEAERWLAAYLANATFDSERRAAKYSVRFWTALALARREQALEIARTCDVHTLTAGRTDLARDALLSLGDPSAQARVLERIDASPPVNTFFTKVCPWLLDELRQQPATHVRVDATTDRLLESQSAESRSADDASCRAQGRGRSTP